LLPPFTALIFALSNLAILFWLLNIILDTAGHLAFKSAAIAEHETEWQRWKLMLSSFPLWLGISCFCLEFVVWLALLSIVPLSMGMLVGSINIVVVMLAGKLLFGERLDRLRVIGMSLVTLGVALAGGFVA
jgi:drug/metabolite transporter (DMT)-like permease